MLPIYVISLERSADRRKLVFDALEKNGIKSAIYISAVDGKTEDFSKYDIDRNKFQRFWHNAFVCCSYNRFYSDSEYATSISHLNLYHKIIDENLEAALILEDDAILNDGCGEIIKNIENLIDLKSIDLLYLYYGDPFRSFTKEIKTPFGVSVKRIGIPGYDWLFNRRRMINSAAAYVITNSGARKILEKAYPIRMQADGLIGLLAFNKMIAYKVVPRPFHISGMPSTILHAGEMGINEKPWYSKLARSIKRLYHTDRK